ncbi:hypothetical protein MLD38_023771 [Melastoma candidum]|uniref:Uncharacterized protein n=1 Tax=Melastoma candidum TaxID=119954 RepID=A0ACB9NQM8_9MYRT|nr:hypothetical protein MLD38_023771 [Melastoma candidum]
MPVRQRLPVLVSALKLNQSIPIAGSTVRLPSLRRAFSLYDHFNLIDNVPEDQLRFQGYTETGFKVNGVSYEGSLICVGNLLMSWSPTKLSEVTPDSLSIFQTLRPIPESLN